MKMFVGDEINSFFFCFFIPARDIGGFRRAMQFALLRINSIGGLAKNPIPVV